MNEQEVRSMLDDLADTPAPPPRVDVSRAVTVGRRQTRVRTWTSIAAASVLVVGLAAGVNYAVSGGSTESATVASAPARFDPLVKYASFGWLPEASKLNSTFTSINAMRFATQARQYIPDPDQPMASLPAPSVNVSFYAAGEEPQSELPLDVWGPTNEPSVPYAPVSDAPAVNGAPAYWVTVPDAPETMILKWRYAPDAWAEVTVSDLDSDLRESAHRVASELRFGGTERMRFPFHFTGPPAGLHPVASTFAEGGLDAPWRVELTLGTEDQGAEVRVQVDPMDDSSRAPNTTVEGHQAQRTIIDGDSTEEQVVGAAYSDMVFVYDVSGLEAGIVFNARTAADIGALGPDGSVSLFRTLTVHPDRGDWTDRPLR
jgi:hypothetical protein